MRFGLRLQILLLLSVLLALAFIPLYFAVSTYAELGLRRQQEAGARSLGRSVTEHVALVRAHQGDRQLLDTLGAKVQGGAVQAIFAFSENGELLGSAGEPALLDWFGAKLSGAEANLSPHRVALPDGEGLAVGSRGPKGPVIAIVRFDAEAANPRELSRLMGLYMLVSALVVLAFAYFILTRSVVRPIVALENAASRVAEGSRKLSPLLYGAPELLELSRSLGTMTGKLRQEEDDLRKKILEVEEARRLLAEAQSSLVHSERLATVGRLSAGLAHEIGNPISALMGFVDLLLAGGLSEAEERDFLERMRREISRIHRVLGDLLAYARPTVPLSTRPLSAGSIEEAVENVWALLGPQKSLRTLRLERLIAPDLPEVPLSLEQLTQVFLNLVMNAIDAVGPEGTITLSAEKHGEGVRCAITDDGEGVPEHVRSTLFEPFVSTKEVGKGTGLGLAVTRGLVQSAGGHIHLDETYERGARFVIELPRAH